MTTSPSRLPPLLTDEQLEQCWNEADVPTVPYEDVWLRYGRLVAATAVAHHLARQSHAAGIEKAEGDVAAHGEPSEWLAEAMRLAQSLAAAGFRRGLIGSHAPMAEFNAAESQLLAHLASRPACSSQASESETQPALSLTVAPQAAVQQVGERESFEEKVFRRRFMASITRNPNPPLGTGALDFISEDCPTKAELCARDGEDYIDPAVSAMWWGWQARGAQLPPQAHAEPTCTVLPDGSAFMTGSFPLPKDHWLYAPRCAEWDDERETSADTPHPILDNSQRSAVKAAIRYAVRGATANGTDMDFDPDALVLNAAYALCGPLAEASQPSPPTQHPQPSTSEVERLQRERNRAAWKALGPIGPAGLDDEMNDAIEDAEAVLAEAIAAVAQEAVPSADAIQQQMLDALHMARVALATAVKHAWEGSTDDDVSGHIVIKKIDAAIDASRAPTKEQQ